MKMKKLIRDIVSLGGLASFTAGVRLEFGWGVALIALGVLLLSASVAAAARGRHAA